MITDITINNFKRFEQIAVLLGENIVFAGPNNSGKTSAIQALTVWRLALTKWLEKRGDNPKSKAKKRTGVPITRLDMTAVPVREVKLLWNKCDVVQRANQPRLIEILVRGLSNGEKWQFGIELQYQGPEMFYCRPMRINPNSEERMEVPAAARELTVVHLPPLAGLQLKEERVNERVLQARISEGRAGDIIRNLLWNVFEKSQEEWKELKDHIQALFQVELLPPQFMSTGEIVVEYHDGLVGANNRNPHPMLDIASGGSGFHQLLLLLAFIYAQPGAVLLFDEPDAHLEIIRQRDIYTLLKKVTQQRNAQLIVASHSEIILDETPHENIIAFLGKKPHSLISNQQKSQLKKSLSEIRSSDYLLAEQKKSILYVEDHTDLAILREWAMILKHPAREFLDSPFVVYVGNVPSHARTHYYGLRDAYPNLRGLMLIDHTDIEIGQEGALQELMWQRREIENYLLVPDAILRFCDKEIERMIGIAEDSMQVNLLGSSAKKLLQRTLLPEVFEAPLSDTPFLLDTKASEVVLEPFFKKFFSQINSYNTMSKSNFWRLAEVMQKHEIHPEIIEVLDSVGKLIS